jgi:hypothetical protein
MSESFNIYGKVMEMEEVSRSLKALTPEEREKVEKYIKNLSHVAERAIFNVSSAVGNSNFTKEELERVVKEYSGKKE